MTTTPFDWSLIMGEVLDEFGHLKLRDAGAFSCERLLKPGKNSEGKNKRMNVQEQHETQIDDVIVSKMDPNCSEKMAACRNLLEARKAFEDGECDQRQLRSLDRHSLVRVLRSCGNLKAQPEGKCVHAMLIGSRNMGDQFLGNTLLEMYGNCAALEETKQVFDTLPKRNVFSWNILMAAYARKGLGKDVLRLFHQMRQEGVKQDVVSWNVVISGYAQHGHCKEALDFFVEMKREGVKPDIVSWNAIISGCAQHQQENTFQLFLQMQDEGMIPNRLTFISVLSACSSISFLAQGKFVHAHILEKRLNYDIVIDNALVNLYAKCALLDNLQQVFDRMNKLDIVSWSTIIAGYAQCGLRKQVMQLIKQIQVQGIVPNRVGLLRIVDSCSNLSDITIGKIFHAYLLHKKFELDITVATAIMCMYARHGCLEAACDFFNRMKQRNVISWTSLIYCHAGYGYAKESIWLFWEMKMKVMQPDEIAFLAILTQCSLLDQGKLIHACVIGMGFQSDFHIGNALVNMYARCLSLDDVKKVFERMEYLDTVSWTSLIAAYAQDGQTNEVSYLFEKMQEEDLKPDEATFVSILTTCATQAAMVLGKSIHNYIIDHGFLQNVILKNSLINMYTKSGNLDDAFQVFNNMHQKNVISWTTMLAGYASHGYASSTLYFFGQMQKAGIRPNEVSFLYVLTACSHTGLLTEGVHYFSLLTKDYVMTPSIEHYVCMVDLLGRSGLVDEAKDFINKMPIEPDDVVWMSYLNACKICSDAE